MDMETVDDGQKLGYELKKQHLLGKCSGVRKQVQAFRER